MNKRIIMASVVGILAMAMTASPAYAQRGGRGGGGGRGYGGGAAYNHAGYGGYNHGGYGGYNHGYYGGYGGYNNGYYGGYGNGWYGRGIGIGGIGFGLGYPYYGGGYYNNGYAWGGYSPNYYSNPDYTYGTYANVQPGTVIDSGLSNYQVQMTGEPTGNTVAMQSFYSGPATNAGSADLTVKVPADAQLWLNNMQSSQDGTERHFGFPALDSGDNIFTLRATWNENGQTITRDRQVNMKAGANTTVDLTKATSDKGAPVNPSATDKDEPTNNPSATHKVAPANPNVGHPMPEPAKEQKTNPPIRPETGPKR
jgi:uncharacterized protein (TIGR03000 family)